MRSAVGEYPHTPRRSKWIVAHPAGISARPLYLVLCLECIPEAPPAGGRMLFMGPATLSHILAGAATKNIKAAAR